MMHRLIVLRDVRALPVIEVTPDAFLSTAWTIKNIGPVAAGRGISVRDLAAYNSSLSFFRNSMIAGFQSISIFVIEGWKR
jgi:hypothetical protein